jgi:predicted DNA binding CopG/RHH family protein
MQTSSVVEALLEDISAMAALGDEATNEVAARLNRALAAPVRLRLMEALTEAAAELNHQLPDGQVEVRLAGNDIELVYAGASESAPPQEDALDARITLRLPEALKAQVERSAAEEGASVNAWIVRALAGNVSRKRTVGNRLTGFAKG